MLSQATLGVGTAVVQLFTPVPSGQSVVVTNLGTSTLFVGGSDVDTINGQEIATLESYTYDLAPYETLYGRRVALTESVLTTYSPAHILEQAAPRRIAFTDGQSGGGGGGGSTQLVATVVTSTAGLPGSPSDGDLALVRLGTYPNTHEVLLKYDSSAGKWISEPITVLTQADTWAMDLGDKSGTRLVDWGLVKNAIPYGKAYTTKDPAHVVTAADATIYATALYGHFLPFDAAGTILIRDNIITYTGITLDGASQVASTFHFTGCTKVSGSGGTIPDNCDIVQGFPGGFGLSPSPLPFAAEMWNAGFRLQEKLVALMNGEPGSAHSLLIAPYWYEYNNGDGSIAPVDPPTGTGVGFSATLTGTKNDGGPGKFGERFFTWAENNWAAWSAGTPTKRFMLPRLFGKMEAGSVDTGEVLDVKLMVRWTS